MTINQTNHEKSKSVHIRLICSIRVLLTMNGTRIERMFTDENNNHILQLDNYCTPDEFIATVLFFAINYSILLNI